MYRNRKKKVIRKRKRKTFIVQTVVVNIDFQCTLAKKKKTLLLSKKKKIQNECRLRKKKNVAWGTRYIRDLPIILCTILIQSNARPVICGMSLCDDLSCERNYEGCK